MADPLAAMLHQLLIVVFVDMYVYIRNLGSSLSNHSHLQGNDTGLKSLYSKSTQLLFADVRT